MNEQNALQPHREAIDTIDAQILTLLNQRAEHARTIGQLKGTGAVYRPEREAQVLSRIRGLNQGPLSDTAVSRLFREVMSECLALEKPLNICYLGPEGTFTHLAAIKHFGHAANLQPCTTIDEAFRTVEAGHADYLVAPVENSTEGAIGRTLDLLVSTPLKACGEVVFPIHHHLLSLSSDKNHIHTVYAHAQALAQCHEWLNQNLPNAKRQPVSSNAQGAVLATEDKLAAAIASQAAAERYGLNKLASNIEDIANNTTRFLVLGNQETSPSGKDKTSLIAGAKNVAGAVHQLLQPFADFGVSMTKLESRPQRGSLWEYVFFIDIEGHQQDENVAVALRALKEKASFLKIVGSYPVAGV
ncbi:MAG: prephenate dehydratase [Neisseriaceae bacterium]|nr:prephenate dehydratase [Neisseriaceae bacterium]